MYPSSIIIVKINPPKHAIVIEHSVKLKALTLLTGEGKTKVSMPSKGEMSLRCDGVCFDWEASKL
jgi:DNA polymerase/3'-5' exonuclease PolX